MGGDQAPAGRPESRALCPGRVHLSAELGLDRPRRRGGHLDQPAGTPARDHHGPPRRPAIDRDRVAGHRDDQDQTSVRPRTEGPAGHRMVVLPRIVITAPASGHGKTTVATGLMAALRDEGLAVAGFKVGPDFIDPGYHSLATGRLGRNLDPVLCGEHRLAPLLLHGAEVPEPADIAVSEGV